jgi:hypothetical protein
MSGLKDVEFAGPFGRAIVRLGGSFHSLVWRDGAGGIAAKLYPAYDRNGEAQAIADAIKCVHHNVPPAPGARSSAGGGVMSASKREAWVAEITGPALREQIGMTRGQWCVVFHSPSGVYSVTHAVTGLAAVKLSDKRRALRIRDALAKSGVKFDFTSWTKCKADKLQAIIARMM